MKKYATLVVSALLCSHAVAGGPLETVAAFHAALAQGDKASAMQLLSPDVLVFESGYVEHARAEYANHHLVGDIAFSKSTKRKVLREGERVDGMLAVVWQETATTGSGQGKDMSSFGTETAVLEKRGDKWMIVHVHWSSRKAK